MLLANTVTDVQARHCHDEITFLFSQIQKYILITDALSLPEDVFAFSSANSNLIAHAFDYSFVYGVKWWTHVSSMVLHGKWPNTLLKHDTAFRKLWTNALNVLLITFSCPNFQSSCDVQNFLHRVVQQKYLFLSILSIT